MSAGAWDTQGKLLSPKGLKRSSRKRSHNLTKIRSPHPSLQSCFKSPESAHSSPLATHRKQKLNTGSHISNAEADEPHMAHLHGFHHSSALLSAPSIPTGSSSFGLFSKALGLLHISSCRAWTEDGHRGHSFQYPPLLGHGSNSAVSSQLFIFQPSLAFPTMQ